MTDKKPKSRYLGYSNHEIGCELEAIALVLEYRGFDVDGASIRHVASKVK